MPKIFKIERLVIAYILPKCLATDKSKNLVLSLLGDGRQKKQGFVTLTMRQS